jgi:hypothetical protein
MTVIECKSCYRGPCHMVESVNLTEDWPCTCMKKDVRGYVEWVRLVDPASVATIRQPSAMKHEVIEYLESARVDIDIIKAVGAIIDQYVYRGK